MTYAGHPLYTYAADAKPGDVKGQNLDQFGAEWYVLAPSGQQYRQRRERAMTTRARYVVAAGRYLGALALLGSASTTSWSTPSDSYSAIPTIGTLFALNFAGATVIAVALALPVGRLPGRAGRVALPLLCLAGIGVAVTSLAALLISESSGLFGFMETGYRPAIVLSIAFEAAAIALLGTALAAWTTGRRRAPAHRAFPRVGTARR